MLKRWRPVFKHGDSSLRMKGADGRQEVPSGLEERLRRIPNEVLLCRDIDRLWAPLLSDELEASLDQRCRDHIGGCPRCHRLVSVLREAREAPEEPREAFLRELRAIPRRPSVVRHRSEAPWWVLDLRYAAALCYALAVLAVGLCGGSAKCFAPAQGWAEPVVGAVERVEDGSRSAVSAFSQMLRDIGQHRQEGQTLETSGDAADPEETSPGVSVSSREARPEPRNQ
ncbi:MAG: hypothetical protein KDD47_04895 [Acidobacteria bacterium]|nr:hypothetical protein [Acidobacteriota bacterium]